MQVARKIASCNMAFTPYVNSHATSSNEQMDIAIALAGVNDLGCSLIPISLLMDHFSTDFLHLAKNEKICLLEVYILQNAPSNSVLFSS